MGERYVVCVAGVAWVGLCSGDTFVAAAHPAACAAYMVCGVVAGVVLEAVVAEACPLNQIGALQQLLGPMRLSPC